MTLDELKALPHVNSMQNGPLCVLMTEQGYYLTTYKDGDDIMTFADTTMMFCNPFQAVYSDFRVINEEEHERLTKEQEEAQEEPIEGNE